MMVAPPFGKRLTGRKTLLGGMAVYGCQPAEGTEKTGVSEGVVSAAWRWGSLSTFFIKKSYDVNNCAEYCSVMS